MKFQDYSTPYEAWSTGFQAALELCLDATSKIPATLEEALACKPQEVTQIDSDTLNLWLNVGRHRVNGAWAIAGARQAVYMILLTLWDHTQIQKAETLPDLFQTIATSDPDFLSGMIATEIDNHLDGVIILTYLDPVASQLFDHYLNR